MLRVLRRLRVGIEAVLVVVVGLGCSQVSGFVGHYLRTLEGRMAEARLEVSGIIARAGEAGMPAYAYLNQYVTASNPAFVHEGEAMQARIDRAGRLIDSYLALRNATVLSLPVIFAFHLDPALAAEVWRGYEPVLPLDATSLLHGVLGMAAMAALLFLGHALANLIGRLWSRRGPATPVAAVSRR